MKKMIYSSLLVVVAGAVSFFLIGVDLGPASSPMAKFFLVFFGGIIVMQIIPAVVLFVCMVKGIVFPNSEIDEQELLVENQGENGLQ